MLRCAIIDDEPLAVSLLESYVSKTPSLELIGSWNDPVEAISRVKELKPDILFLDIQMPDLDGMDLSRMVPENTKVIFTTAFKQYAFESYDVSALDFLLKPISYRKFLTAIDKARTWFDMKNAAASITACAPPNNILFFKVDGTFKRIELTDISYIEGMKDYVKIYLQSEEDPVVTHITMKALEDQLPESNFIRVHRSFIVALDKMTSVTPGGDIVIGSKLIHVSDAYRESFLKKIPTVI
ncbi:MAG: LytTR family DNA-binding domain-containing protein [Bacteroidales bacterium]|nr:LytTR family DNA-binding domain-containing protein [Bacteroidales bacterium]